jgi:CRP-like cAMP-binding protein
MLVQALSEHVPARLHDAGEVVCECGELADHLLVVEEGELELYLPLGEEDVLPVARLTCGQFFGELALRGDRCRTVSARTVRPSRVLAVGPGELMAFLRTHPEAAGDLAVLDHAEVLPIRDSFHVEAMLAALADAAERMDGVWTGGWN